MNLQNLQAELAEAIQMNEQHNELIYCPQNLVIHKNNIQSTLQRTLKATYPMIGKLVGSEFLQMTANAYINAYPSLTGNLNDYGEYFADFLADFAPAKELIYLPEVAKFEWLCHTLSTAAEHAPLDIKTLEQVAPEHYTQLRFTLSPCCEIVQFTYPILRIIALCKNETSDPINVDAGGVNLLLHRKQGNVALISLTLGEYLFLTAIRDNQPLGHALDSALDQDPSFKLDEMLPLWIKNRIIVECHVGM